MTMQGLWLHIGVLLDSVPEQTVHNEERIEGAEARWARGTKTMARCWFHGVQHRPLVDSHREDENVGLSKSLLISCISWYIRASTWLVIHRNIINLCVCAGGITMKIVESLCRKWKGTQRLRQPLSHGDAGLIRQWMRLRPVSSFAASHLITESMYLITKSIYLHK